MDRVRDATDIVELISDYIPLKKAGRSFKALCPFHEDKDPSFNVNPERQSFYCFGCAKGGDAFGFVMAHDNMAFPEAVEMLAQSMCEEAYGDNPDAPPWSKLTGGLRGMVRDVWIAAAELQVKEVSEE